MNAEKLGVPAVAVITDTFVQTAAQMAKVIGMEGYRFAVIPHPFSSNSEEVLRQKAADTVRQGLGLLTDPERPQSPS